MADKTMTEKYRFVFSTEVGKEVFADILLDLGLMVNEMSTPEGMAVHNARKNIMRKCGLLNPLKATDLIDSWLQLPFENKNTQESIDGDE